MTVAEWGAENYGQTKWLLIKNGVADFSDYGTDLQAGPNVTDGAWHMLTGICDGSAATLYVDGKMVAGPTAATFATTSSTIKVGHGIASYPFVGSMDEMGVWSRAPDGRQGDLALLGGLRALRSDRGGTGWGSTTAVGRPRTPSTEDRARKVDGHAIGRR